MVGVKVWVVASDVFCTRLECGVQLTFNYRRVLCLSFSLLFVFVLRTCQAELLIIKYKYKYLLFSISQVATFSSGGDSRKNHFSYTGYIPTVD